MARGWFSPAERVPDDRWPFDWRMWSLIAAVTLAAILTYAAL